ncbi:MAG: FAD-dependent oxidoreductase [Gemmatimonadetes bacterium]|nr:FAD-dependent oxidoreductase [Gemmatimonadota bacterium]
MTRVAIIGSGVSGLVVARGLRSTHDITVFEADRRIGGHVHTWTVERESRTWAIDSGFIVYNERNYPHFTRLIAELGVPTQPSTMSFSVRHDGADLEYNGSTIRQLFAQKRNLLRPSFLRMLTEILRFNREATAAAGSLGDAPIRELLDRGGYSAAFRDWYLLPMGSAIWSIPASTVLAMPARFFVQFFSNHGMLTVDDRPEWRVVSGGSSRYVGALVAPFRDQIRTGSPVRRVSRFADRVEVNGEAFDRVVLACHSDQALAILAEATPLERELLGSLPYQANEAVLHTDASVLPRRRAAWGAWNYRLGHDAGSPAVVTYNMNLLQSLEAPVTFCVTLNGDHLIDPAQVIGRVQYHHPVATVAGAAARARRSEVSGAGRTHYCGAYWGNGFHEDGVASGLAVVSEIGSP